MKMMVNAQHLEILLLLLCSYSCQVVNSFVAPSCARQLSNHQIPKDPTIRRNMSREQWDSSDKHQIPVDPDPSDRSTQSGTPFPDLSKQLVRDISDFGHPQQRANAMGRRTTPTAFEKTYNLSEEEQEEKDKRAGMIRDISDLKHRQQGANPVGRRPTATVDAPWKEPSSSSSLSEDTSKVKFKPRKEKPEASTETASVPSAKDELPSSTPPPETRNDESNPRSQSQPPPPPPPSESRRPLRDPNQLVYDDVLVFDEMSPLERFEKQRKESLDRTQRQIDKEREPGFNDYDIIDTEHFQDGRSERLIYDDDDYGDMHDYPQRRKEDRQEDRGREDEEFDEEVQSSLESEIKEIKEEMDEMKEQQKSLLQSLLKVQDTLDLAVRIVKASERKKQTINSGKPVSVPSSFFFKDQTANKNSSGRAAKTSSSTTTGSTESVGKKTMAEDKKSEESDDDSPSKILIDGIEMTQSTLEKLLSEDCSIEKYGQVGDKFDPRYHTAMYEIEDVTKKSGTISQVITDGYKDNKEKKILRHAEVAVVKNRDDEKN